MSTEKKIRLQAKQKLNGKWVLALAAVFTVFGALFAVYLVFSLFATIGTSISPDGEVSLLSVGIVTFGALLTISAAVILMLVKNGFFRIFYNIANSKPAQYSDLFYYFKNGRYIKALGFDLIMTLKKMLWALICFLPYIAASVISYSDSSRAGLVFQSIFFALGLAAYVLNTLKYFWTEFLYNDDDYIDISTAFRVTGYVVKKRRGDIYMLFCTFLPYMALCFFVLPALYVLPYMLTSAATSAKWLFKLYKDGKMI